MFHPVDRRGQRGFRPPFAGGVKPPGQAIYCGVDCPGPQWSGFLVEKPAFTEVSLSDLRVIMMIMCVFVEELLCQAVMGQILVLKYLLSGMRGHLWPCPIMPDTKYCCFLRTRSNGAYPVLKTLRRGYRGPGHVPSWGDEADWADRW
jgi:hypothetical protein